MRASKLKFKRLIRAKRRKESLLENYEKKLIEQFRLLTIPLLMLNASIFVGTIGYMIIAHLHTGKVHFIDAFYMTVITIGTIGYGEVSPASDTPVGRVFSSFLALMGIGIFTTSVTVIIRTVSSGNIIELYRVVSMLKDIQELENHIILCGYNKTSAWLADALKKRKMDFVVIDDRRSALEFIQKHNIRYFISEDPIRKATLMSAGIKKAKVLIANLEDDARNIALIVTARLIRPSKEDLTIFSFASTDGTAEKMEELGANKALVPNKILATRLSSYIFHTGSTYISDLLDRIAFGEESEVDMVEYRVDANSPLIGKKLKDIDLRKRYKISVIAIRRRDGQLDINISGETTIEEGDTLVLFGNTKNLKDLWKIYRELAS